jgi:hypothetical protein
MMVPDKVRRVLSHPCVDCGMETTPVKSIEPDGNGNYTFFTSFNSSENFLLWDLVWEQTGLGPHDGALCVRCTEVRLGRRRLQRTDFNFFDTGYNVPDLSTKRLLLRMLPPGYARQILNDNRDKGITMTLRSEDLVFNCSDEHGV